MPIGYGGYVCSEPGVVVHIPVGYGDGILTYYQGARIFHNGVYGKIHGRVNMDMTAVFFKKEDQDKVNIGDQMNLWDHDGKSIMDFSKDTKSIPYQIFTSIAPRVPRTYIYN